MADALVDAWRDIEQRHARATPTRFVPFMTRLAGGDGRTAGSRARSRTPTRACRTAAPTRRWRAIRRCRSSACPTARPARVLDETGDHAGQDLPEPPTGADRPGPRHRRLPGGAGSRCRRTTRRRRYTGARGGRERPPPGVPARRHPVHGLLVRAVEGPGRRTSRRARTRIADNELPRLRLAEHAARDNADGTWDLPEPAATRRQLCRRSPTHEYPAHARPGEQPGERLERPREPARPPSPSRPTRRRSRATTPTTTTAPAELGYRLTVPISMANDYNGYIATYREYQRGDHYRKALTAWGPHSSDYMATRLVAHGRPPERRRRTCRTRSAQAQGRRRTIALNDAARQQALGRRSASGVVAGLRGRAARRRRRGRGRHPAAGRRALRQAALFTWNGGSNFTDNPDVRVQRQVDGGWVDYADQSGEIPVTLEVPAGPGRARATSTGDQQVGVDGALRGVRLQLRPRSSGRERTPAGHLPVRGGRRAPRGRRGGALPSPRVAVRR